MHARMLCINAPLQICEKKAPSGSAGAKITTRESSNTLAGVRKPCCRNRRLPPLLQATVKYQEYMLLHYLDTDSSWRKGEICRNSGHREWSMPSASSTSSPLDKVVNITRMCTVPSLYHAISTACTRVPSRPEQTALRREAGACIHVVVQTGSI